MAETATGTYDRAAETVFAALVEGLSETRLRVLSANPEQGLIRAMKGRPWPSWNQTVTIVVDPRGPEETDVIVESRLRLQRYPFAPVHQRNIAAVFDMLDRRLGTFHSRPPGL